MELKKAETHRFKVRARTLARLSRIRAPSFAADRVTSGIEKWPTLASLLSVRLPSLRCNLRYYCTADAGRALESARTLLTRFSRASAANFSN